MAWSLALFGFLLASFPARNLDLWVHLAAGRDLISGNLGPQPGVLFDLGIWAFTWSLGGSLLVLLKAVLIALLARNLIAASPGDRPWLVALGLGLALLAMANRLLLQPMVLSLVLASWLLTQLGEGQKSTPRWAILLVCLAWALLDPVFAIAGILALVVLMGAVLDHRARGPQMGLLVTWILGVGVGLALWAGLASRTPGGFSALFEDWVGSDLLARSPFRADFREQALQSPSSLAFFPLLFLGFLGVVLGWRGMTWALVLGWSLTTVGACLHHRLIPWLAVMAGPVIATGLTAAFARAEPSQTGTNSTPRSPWLGNALGWGVLGLFLVLSWPGWLQLPPYGPRHWAFDPHPAWKDAGTRVEAFRARGWQVDPGEKISVAVSSAPLARALSWFHPQIDWQVEPRLVGPDSFEPKSRLVLALDPDKNRWQSTLQAFLMRAPQWQLAHLGGSLAFFSRSTERAKGLPTWDPETEAFALGSPTPDPEDFSDAPIPEDRDGQWWRSFFAKARGWKTDREDAELLLVMADLERQKSPGRAMRAWVVAQAASLGPAASSWILGFPMDAFLRVQMLGPIRQGAFDPNSLKPVENWSLQLQEFHGASQGLTSPGPLYLAIRSLRREMRESWPDALTRNLLAETYQRLALHSSEALWARKVPGISQLRRVQAVKAMAEAVRLAPNQPESRLVLGRHFQELGYRDLAYEQLSIHQTLLEEVAVPPGPAGQAFLKDLADNRRRLASIEEDLTRRLGTFEKNSQGLRVFDRAQMAMELGLAGKALSTLLQSDIAAFGLPGMQMEIQLLLFSGAARQVRDWAESEPLDNQDEQNLRWTRIQAFAAMGQYGSARKESELMSFPADAQESKDPPRELAALVLGQAVLEGFDTQPHLGGLVTQVFQRRRTQGRLEGLGRDLRLEAEGLALSGLLALEEGRVALAKDYFLRAMAVRNPRDANWDFESRPMAEELLGRIDAANR